MSDDRQLSKFLSYVLRHRPTEVGVSIDKQGWVAVDALIEAAYRNGYSLDHSSLARLVEASDKKRFTISSDGTRIRAAQGHSTDAVDLSFTAACPPQTLYHGTARAKLPSILQKGLRPGGRHYVHLSLDNATALQVGRRHGPPVVLMVRSGAMYEDGLHFYRADNGVWLTRFVAPRYLRMMEDGT